MSAYDPTRPYGCDACGFNHPTGTLDKCNCYDCKQFIAKGYAGPGIFLLTEQQSEALTLKINPLLVFYVGSTPNQALFMRQERPSKDPTLIDPELTLLMDQARDAINNGRLFQIV